MKILTNRMANILKITLGVLLITACLAGGLAACGQIPPAQEAVQDKTLDIYTNSVSGGSLVFPESWQGKYVTTPQEEHHDRMFIKVYNKSNHDKYQAEKPEFGYLFSIERISLADLEKNSGWNGGNMGDGFRPFAQNKINGQDWIYFVRTPTGVQYDPGDDELMKEYLQLAKEIPLLLQSFSDRGKLAEYASEIKLLKYRNGEVKNTVVIPRSNKELFKRIPALLDAASPTKMPSVNDAPDAKSYVTVMLSPQNVAYLYEKGGKYYAEKPYQSIKELTKEAYQEIISSVFGVILADPDTLDKRQFLKPVRDMIALYQAGTPPENGMELKFEDYPQGEPYPTVKTEQDFILDEGRLPECQYTATVRFGAQNQGEMVMQFNSIPNQTAAGGSAEWQITGVSFQKPAPENMSAWMFDLAIANRFDYVPEFAEGKAPSESPDYLYYAFILDLKDWKAGNEFLTKEYVEKVITSHFPVQQVIHKSSDRDWNFDGRVYTVRPGDYNTAPVYGLKQYKSYRQNGRTIYDVVLAGYAFHEFSYQEMNSYTPPPAEHSNEISKPMQDVLAKKGGRIESNELKVWQAIREMITEGDTAKFNQNSTERLKFYFDEKTNNIVFLEHGRQ